MIGTRRSLFRGGSSLGLTLLGIRPASAMATLKKGDRDGADRDKGEDIGPGEDLMREHGVLRRVLLVYGEVVRRIESGAGFDPDVVQKSARLVRTFIEDYHERQEEEMVFPRFERARKLVDLVHTLRAQHQAGRRVTDRVLALATPAGARAPDGRRQLRAELLAFGRMYEPHAAREDTVLFPALHQIVSRSEYDALGEDFERREHQAFGAGGFEHAVAQVAALEKTLGIDDLARFTPQA